MAIKFTETKRAETNAETKGVGKGKAKSIAGSKKPAGKRSIAKSKTNVKKA